MLCDCHVYPTLPASDMARARQFYEQTLGFEPSLVTPGGVMYDAHGSRFFIYPTQASGGNQATYMAFEVDDLRKMVDELRTRGVKFQEYDLPDFKTENGLVDTPDGPGAWLKDTEGNIIALFQPVQKLQWPREMVSAGRSA
jgi:catechol 2,3-dioxygenase-like lactoylglutathione lyase family enzyme